MQLEVLLGNGLSVVARLPVDVDWRRCHNNNIKKEYAVHDPHQGIHHRRFPRECHIEWHLRIYRHVHSLGKGFVRFLERLLYPSCNWGCEIRFEREADSAPAEDSSR